VIPNRGAPDVCTPNNVNVFDVGDSYARKPVSPEGAILDWIAIDPALLRELSEAVNPLSRGSNHVFPTTVAPISSKTYMAQRAFFVAVRRNRDISQLAVEEAAMRLVECVLTETSPANELPRRRATKGGTLAREAEAIRAAKRFLALNYSENVSIAEIAENVHYSPGFISRIFRRCGFTIHDYLQHIRLRMSLDMVADAKLDGAGIAAQLGFATHSHFSSVFKRQFGTSPSEFAKTLSRSSLSNMHRLLDRNEQYRKVRSDYR